MNFLWSLKNMHSGADLILLSAHLYKTQHWIVLRHKYHYWSLFLALQEKQRMTDKLEDTSLRLKDEMDLYRKIMDKLWHNRHEFQKEKESMQEVRQST